MSAMSDFEMEDPDASKTQVTTRARFSKVPIINGPSKLSPLTLKIEVSIVLHLT